MIDMETNVTDLKNCLDNNTPCVVLDVREKWELDICCLEKAKHIPLGSILSDDYADLPKDKPLFVFCHHGRRSLQAVCHLRDKGYDNAVSVQGGIHAWACEADPTLSTY
ncbi:MAG: rhodanese-like domain-containing protein [Alphaproteobacteria bacterium]|nr:rhodanese-like domain-containing protein [Alphaproteobacteria bacterium]